MKLSQWKARFQGLIAGVEGEVGVPIPALEEFRAHINEAAPVAEKRKDFEDQLEAFLDSQPFLREATSRYLGREAAKVIGPAAAVLRREQPFLPKDETTRDGPTENESRDDETAETAQLEVIDVWDAIKSAEEILPGHAAAEGKTDPRWQAIIKVEDFIRDEPDAIWPFIVRWGSHADEDLRTAVATCLLEHLLQHHFERFFPRLEEEVQSNALLADTFSRCWKLGQAAGGGNTRRFEDLQAKCRRIKSSS
jgi:hypothetical protein